MVVGLSLWTYTLALAVFFGGLVLSLFFADAQVRLHAYQVVESVNFTAQTVQAVWYSEERQKLPPLTEWMRDAAERRLKARALPGLREDITRFDVEKAGPHILRVTMETKAVFTARPLSWIGANETRYRAISSQETEIGCMPADLRAAAGPKGPAIVRRNTGLIDKILLRGEGDVDPSISRAVSVTF